MYIAVGNFKPSYTMIKHVTAALQKFADFKGRATRPEFWYFFLFNLIVTWGVYFILAMVMGEIAASMVQMIVSLALLIPYLAVAVRRMHDLGKSGWFILIPIYNLILFATEGEKGDNEYGPDPLETDTQFDFEKDSAAK
ncbi:DUF805 domain-containing protein [Chitinophaga rhizosphaerae]|uniref:DUF805 domain-containing protein n=1 Tax=Chitinophaga rhizosphaerae TaxID=1864947 RepID=UPI001F0C9DD3|nr:DUF805 domain-containing protein [Chitinophaga rhizosphaerae]